MGWVLALRAKMSSLLGEFVSIGRVHVCGDDITRSAKDPSMSNKACVDNIAEISNRALTNIRAGKQKRFGHLQCYQ